MLTGSEKDKVKEAVRHTTTTEGWLTHIEPWMDREYRAAEARADNAIKKGSLDAMSREYIEATAVKNFIGKFRSRLREMKCLPKEE